MKDPDPLERLEDTAERIAYRATYEQSNRRGLLWVHALIGMLAGPQMLLWGSASIIEASTGTWSRPVMACLGLTGGAFLALGLTRRPRSVPLEAIGLAVVGLWDVLMTLGLAYARIHQNDYHVLALGEPLPQGYASAYPITIYAGLAALIGVHLWTLRRFGKSGLRL